MLCDLGEVVRRECGVRSLPPSRTRCLGVERDDGRTSLKRGAEGVEKLGGMFSLAALSEVGSAGTLNLVDLAAGIWSLFWTIRVDEAVRFVTGVLLRVSWEPSSSYI